MKKLLRHIRKWYEWATDPCNGDTRIQKILVLFGAPAPTFSAFITRKERMEMWKEISQYMSGMVISIADYKRIKDAHNKYRERTRDISIADYKRIKDAHNKYRERTRDIWNPKKFK